MSGRLWSDHPITFEYGPAEGQSEQVKGSADQIDITLIASDETMLGDDLPRIAGIKQITLRRNVNLDMVVEEDDRAMPVAVHCDGVFDYDVQNLVATLNENVEVTRPTHMVGELEQLDRLLCDRLVLQFEEQAEDTIELISREGADRSQNVQTVSGIDHSRMKPAAGLNLNLELRALHALGTDVFLTSDEQDVTAKLQELRYNLKTRTLRLLDDQRVEVKYKEDVLACPDIEMTHDENGVLQTATCLGVGQAWRMNPETGKIVVESSWTDHLVLRPDEEPGLTLLEMSGDARAMQRLQQSGVIGDVMSVWLESSSLKHMDGGVEETNRLPIRRVLAEQTGEDPVAMVSPSLHLMTARLEAVFEERASDEPAQGGGRTSDVFGENPNVNEDDPPVVVTAGEVRAEMTFDPVSQKPDFAEINATSNVHVSRTGASESITTEIGSDGDFSIDCESLILVNGADGHILKLQGQPARIELPRNDRIEGDNILFDRGANRAEVQGAGTLVVHVDRDLDGERLDELLPLTVKWKERMTFDGQNAAFLGETVTTLSDSHLRCEELDVSLNRRIDFSVDRPNTKDTEVQSVHGRHNVLADFYEYSEQTTVKGIRKMDVAEFSFDRETGAFHAKGPGIILDWQKGDGRSLMAAGPRVPPPANEAGDDSALPWNFTQLKFSGDMTGNQLDRYVELENRVEVTHAPVEHALENFSRGEISELNESAKEAVWLGSDRMRLTLVPHSQPDADETISVIAFGNAEVEGQTFGARGHSISYDQSKDLFTLRGNSTDAYIWQQDSPGSPARPQSAKMIQYVPSKQLILTGARSVNLSQ